MPGLGSATLVTVGFTPSLRRHVDCPADTVAGATVREVLQAYFAAHPAVRGYVLDEQGAVRRHVTVFHNGRQIHDRESQADAVAPGDEIHVMQALSGG